MGERMGSKGGDGLNHSFHDGEETRRAFQKKRWLCDSEFENIGLKAKNGAVSQNVVLLGQFEERV